MYITSYAETDLFRESNIEIVCFSKFIVVHNEEIGLDEISSNVSIGETVIEPLFGLPGSGFPIFTIPGHPGRFMGRISYFATPNFLPNNSVTHFIDVIYTSTRIYRQEVQFQNMMTSLLEIYGVVIDVMQIPFPKVSPKAVFTGAILAGSTTVFMSGVRFWISTLTTFRHVATQWDFVMRGVVMNNPAWQSTVRESGWRLESFAVTSPTHGMTSSWA